MVTNSVLSSANAKHSYDCGLGQTCELGAGARDVAGSIDRILAIHPTSRSAQGGADDRAAEATAGRA
jgi:hypothetical protein